MFRARTTGTAQGPDTRRTDLLSALGLDTSEPPSARNLKIPYIPGRWSPGITLQGDPARFGDGELASLVDLLADLQGPAANVRDAFRQRGCSTWGGTLLARLPQPSDGEDSWLVRLPLGETSIHASAAEAVRVISAEILRLDAIRPGRTVAVQGLGSALVVDDGAERLRLCRVAPGDLRLLPRLATLEQAVIHGERRFLLTMGRDELRFADCGQPEPFADLAPLAVRVSPRGWNGDESMPFPEVPLADIVGPAA